MNWEGVKKAIKEGDFYYTLPEVLRLICVETSASRCNFWYVEEGFLVPVYNYDAEGNDYTLEGLESINLKDVPRYYQGLLRRNILFLEDVYKNETSSELSEIYWKPSSIQSSVDLILKHEDKPAGVLCIEFRYKKSFSDEEKKSLKNLKNILEKSYRRTLKLEEFAFKNLLEQLLNSPNISVVMTNKSGIIRFANETFKKTTGYNTFEVLNRKASIMKSGLHPQEFYKDMWDTILSGKVWDGTVINRKKNGELYYERKTIVPIIKKREIIGFLSIGYDITEEARLKKTRLIFEEVNRLINTYEDDYELLEKTCEVLYKGGDYKLVWVGKRVGSSVSVVCAYGAKEYLKDIKISLEEQSPFSRGPTGRAFLTGKTVAFNNFKEIPDYVPWRDRAMSFGFMSSASIPIKVRGITEYAINLYSSEKHAFTNDGLKILEETATKLGLALEKIAMKGEMLRKELYDELTGLPNRKLFLEELDYNIDLAKGFQEKLFLLVIDIFNFSFINTRYGISLGDRILLSFVEKLKRSCPEAHLFARSGADEFAIAIFSDKDIDDITSELEALKEMDITVDDVRVKLFTNIGIAVYPKDAKDGKSLFDRAIVALKKCKERGRGCYCVYDSGLEAEVRTRLELEHDIPLALEKGEFFLYYQPIVNAYNLTLAGVEALIRWFSPKRGFVSPAIFIPMAESMGIMRELDAFVLRSVRSFFYRMKNLGYDIPKISVNITPSSFDLIKDFFSDRDFIKHIRVEITEREFFEVFKHKEVLNRFLELGGSLSIDDFGTGYSSLSYLSELPAQWIKIDMSFVKKIVEDEKTKRIVEAITEIARTFGMFSVAEGVETEEQYELIKKLGCDGFQGYFYSPPLSEKELIDRFVKSKEP